MEEEISKETDGKEVSFSHYWELDMSTLHDSPEGTTHSWNDQCGMPDHNKPGEPDLYAVQPCCSYPHEHTHPEEKLTELRSPLPWWGGAIIEPIQQAIDLLTRARDSKMLEEEVTPSPAPALKSACCGAEMRMNREQEPGNEFIFCSKCGRPCDGSAPSTSHNSEGEEKEQCPNAPACSGVRGHDKPCSVRVPDSFFKGSKDKELPTPNRIIQKAIRAGWTPDFCEQKIEELISKAHTQGAESSLNRHFRQCLELLLNETKDLPSTATRDAVDAIIMEHIRLLAPKS